MTQIFTPKFVDMVRVNSSTQGTGPLVCGSAVPGFASFAEAVVAGDSFYYSIQGVDRPQEREVGRGTYQANNTITREPLRGTLTNFTSGTKTIALVAASEWYSRLQATSTQSAAHGSVLSRSALKAVAGQSGGDVRRLNEAGREGVFSWDPAVPIATHQADTAEGIYVAPNAAAHGAWVRRYDGAVNPAWFGMVTTAGAYNATNAAANFAAWTAMIACLVKRAYVLIANYQHLGTIRFPLGRFDFADTLQLTDGTVNLDGEGAGKAGSPGTYLRFPAGKTGIIVQRENTSGASGGAVAISAFGDGSFIRGFGIEGGFAGAEGEFHGILLRARAVIENLEIARFQGTGIHVEAGAGDALIEGNANLFRILGTRVIECRDGIYLRGADANAGTILDCDTSYNRRWGINDDSFLGNAYIGCHSDGNGYTAAAAALAPTQVSHNGNRYAVVVGQEAGASTNAPSGTTADNAWWFYINAGGPDSRAPAWASGTTYRAGGAYRTSNANARNCFVGCYSESGQSPAQAVAPTLVMGGLQAAGIKGTASFLDATITGLFVRSSLRSSGDFEAQGFLHSMGPPSGTAQNNLLTFRTTSQFNTLRFDRFNAAGALQGTDGLLASYSDGNLIAVARAEGYLKIGTTVSGSATTATWDATGINLAAGKALKVAGTQVVGARDTGWTAATGTGSKGAFAAAAAGTASATYTQSELQGALNRTAAAEARIVSLEAALRGHGLIN